MFMFRSRALQTLTAAAAVTAGLVLSAPAALAHDLVIGGDPADKEILQEFPDRIELEFSGYVMEDFNTFAVSDAASEEVLFAGEPLVDGRLVSLDVPVDVDPGAGDYRIGFQITSSDGHSTRGMTTFSVAGDNGGAAAPAEQEGETEVSADQQPEATGLPEGPITWVLAGVGILAVLGVIAMMIARGRNTTQE